MNRREFINTTVAGAGALLIGQPLVATATARTFDPFEKIKLGKTGLEVSRFCLGTGMRGSNRQSNHTRMGQARFTELVRGAYERGARMFDLADLYGTHPFFAQAMKDIPRDQYVIATKIWFRPGALPESERPDADVVVQRFLKELNTDYLDLVLLHCVTSDTWNSEQKRQMEILAGLKAKGTIRAHGVSCHSLGALRAAAADPWVDSVHARINPYGVAMDGPAEEVVPILKQIHNAGKGVVGMKLIGEGRFREDEEKRNESVKFALNVGCVDVMNVGCENLAEVDDFTARVRKVSM